MFVYLGLIYPSVFSLAKNQVYLVDFVFELNTRLALRLMDLAYLLAT
ncbi:hypothetical protein P4S68_20010 [Pseudoalteromonas sp. Hal099]